MRPGTTADFGTYHHLSMEESNVIRKHVQRLFVEAFWNFRFGDRLVLNADQKVFHGEL